MQSREARKATLGYAANVSWFSRRGERYQNLIFTSLIGKALILGITCLDLGMNKKTNTSFIEASVWGANFFKCNFKRLVKVKTQQILRTSSGMNRAFHHFHLP
ncbi:hypothetical protein POTOM_040228 [Populus tomentosa]|uniref:Berberine/berberine-like domain-containing protein n=1 Tax=Populus tomentosa TaxID=118781 RepID=A0A8X8CJS1_POPTO|nr:hypothetical protein POTOM_040228 [Populus tomentosa]